MADETDKLTIHAAMTIVSEHRPMEPLKNRSALANLSESVRFLKISTVTTPNLSDKLLRCLRTTTPLAIEATNIPGRTTWIASYRQPIGAIPQEQPPTSIIQVLVMRRPLIAGNWKMNLTRAESMTLAQAISQGQCPEGVDVLVCPTFVYLDAVSGVLDGTSVKLGGQDAYHESNGAFTGAISMTMLADLGCDYVILGHSERRHVMGETDAMINAKIKVALATGITPILCLGELLQERESGQTQAVVESQLDGSLAGLNAEHVAQTVIAYEPVWAIGTGKTATPEQAQEVHADLRKSLENRYNATSAASVQILYGGSVKPSNAAELLSQPDIDGALVGGASLKAESFLEIIAASATETAS